MIEMAVRTIGQVAAGAAMGAALVAVPVWATTSSRDDDSTHRSGMTSMMSDPQAQQQMTRAMSQMMSDPKLRKQMVSMMSEAMSGMKGMSGMPGMPSDDMSGMGDMPGLGATPSGQP